ncbi:MAG: hypothetical protein IKW03_09420 [Clostridia bacterium]|nr:hypothetical protein [Clostridia bacterium]
MKKAYSRPIIVFDNFELTENIAAGCSYISSNIAPYQCAVLDKEFGYTIFSDYSICDSTPPGGNDSICYHVPTADYSVYTS